MTIRVWETSKSRIMYSVGGRDAYTVLRYVAHGSEDDAAIRAAIEAEIPIEYDGKYRDGFDVAHLGGGVWECTIPYRLPEMPTPGGPNENVEPTNPSPSTPLSGEYSFTTVGGTVHITSSKETRESKRAGGGNAPDYQRAIGVSKNGVEGVDIPAPKLELTVTRKFGSLTFGYLKTARDLTATTNTAPAFGFAVAECLFLGVNGSYNSGQWSVSGTWLIGKNETNIEITDGLTIEEKKAHDYLWVGFGETSDAVANVLVQKPMYAYVERVHDAANHAQLGLS